VLIGSAMKRTIIFAAVLIATLCAATYFAMQTAMLKIHMAFAEEQTAYFEEMHERAATALSEAPSDVRAAVGYIKAIREYYPSGTKQTRGSRLDLVVERARNSMIGQIVGDLRRTADHDLGDKPGAWMKAFGSEDATQYPAPRQVNTE
jgi:hypothetical protein